jgi:hypothetical protein
LKCLLPDDVDPNAPVFLGGGTQPNRRFRELCALVGVSPKPRSKRLLKVSKANVQVAVEDSNNQSLEGQGLV